MAHFLTPVLEDLLLLEHASHLTEAQQLDVLQAIEHMASPEIRNAATRISATLARYNEASEMDRREAAKAAWMERAAKVCVALTVQGELARHGIEHAEWDESVAVAHV